MQNARQRHKRHGLILRNRRNASFPPAGSSQLVGIVELALELQCGRRFFLLRRGKVPVPPLPRFFFKARGQYQGAVHRRLKSFLIGHGGGVQVHGEAQFDAIPVLPGSTQNEIAARVREGGKRTSIYFDAAVLRPVRNAQFQININWFGRRDRERGSLLFGERGLLCNAYAFVWPARHRKRRTD